MAPFRRPRSIANAGALAAFLWMFAAGGADGQNPRAQQSRPAVRETPASLPRDRYSSAKPLSLEGFCSVFKGLDLDKNGVLTIKEARAGAIADSVFQQYDLDKNQAVTSQEFDWIYGASVRARGQILDSDLTNYLETLDVYAKERRWAQPVITKQTAEPPANNTNPRGRYSPESKPSNPKNPATRPSPKK